MCKFGEQVDWIIRVRAIGFYIDVNTRKYQDRLINPIPLERNTG